MAGVDPLFSSGGEMAGRMRRHDWARTPLGPSTSWSQSLRTAVAIMLRSRYPMILTWGEQLVMLYNDAFIPTLGAKHPDVLGGPLSIGFAEVWDDVGPMQQSVLAGGPSTWAEDLPLTIERGNGPEQAYFTFSYSHVPDDDGPGGVLAVLTVTTDKVVAASRLALLNALASVAGRTHDPAEAVSATMEVLASARDELVGARLYRAGAGPDPRFEVVGTCGPPCDRFPAVLDRTSPVAEAWDAQRTVLDRTTCDGHGADALHVVLPLRGADETAGVLVLCPHPLRLFDDDHDRFAALLADQVAQILTLATDRAREQARLEALAALDAAKTAFLSNVSHEFRTPLTLLLGPLDDRLSGRTGIIEGPDLQVMHDSAHRLLRMVNGLLDVARIEADGLPVVTEPTDLAELTDDVLQPFASAAARAQLALEVDLDPTVGVVQVDPALWEKAVVNLVANAVKYTPVGTVRVELRRSGDQVVLEVSDTGVGIPADQLGRVFERFHRVQQTGGRTIEGTGIGLALVAEAARILGGSTEVSSEVGVGSTFRLSAPLEPLAAPAAPYVPDLAGIDALGRDLTAGATPTGTGPDEVVRHGTGRSDRTILVAEDNLAMRSRIARVLADEGEVVTVADGLAALGVLRSRQVDLLVTDVMMPELDGLGLLKEVRADAGLRGLPVVLLSARAGAEAAVGAIEAGADDYVVKPFSTGELVARCRTTMELAQHRRTEAASRARSALLAGVSHDMQTPLAVISSALELISGDEMPLELTRRTAARARVRAAQLAQLVTQFLDWSRLSMNEPLPVRVRPSDLREVAERVVADHPRAVVVAGDDDVRATFDPQRTEQVLHNLVDNAEKVARSVIEVRLSVEDDALLARVADDGSGVSDTVLPRLFEAFGPSVGARGSGLGLHVSREAARAQGGDLYLETTGPAGSVFVLVVPRTRP
jgi:signal transduction histidine kinase